MDPLFLALKFVHIVAVIVWLGGLVALAVINALAARGGDAQSAGAVGRLGAEFGQRVVGPAGGVTLLAGVATAARIGYPFTSAWIVWGAAAIVGSLLLGAFPIRRAAEALSAIPPADGARIAAARSRLSMLGVANLGLLFSAVFAMVFKPTL